MTPLVLNEHQVNCFSFYLNSQVHQGMHYETGLYGLAYSFGPSQRAEAYRLGYQLADSSITVVISVSEHFYKVWVSLNATEYPYWNAMSNAATACA